ncbi:MAG: hypothetical protein QW154_03470 [Sulfolobales archaeon]
MSKKLMLSSGKIFGNYSLLEKYLEVCQEKNVESLPNSSDIEFVKYIASRGPASLDRFLEELVRRFKQRVDPACSVRASKEVLSMELTEDHASQLVATQLAGWTLEIAEALGVIKLKKLS